VESGATEMSAQGKTEKAPSYQRKNNLQEKIRAMLAVILVTGHLYEI